MASKWDFLDPSLTPALSHQKLPLGAEIEKEGQGSTSKRWGRNGLEVASKGGRKDHVQIRSECTALQQGGDTLQEMAIKEN